MDFCMVQSHARLTEHGQRSYDGGLVSQLVPRCTVVLTGVVGTHGGKGQVLRGSFRHHVVR